MDTKKYWKEVAGKEYAKMKRFSVMQELLDYDLKEFSDCVAISWLNNKRTYKELINDIALTRKLLLNKGLKKKMNVGLVFKNDYNFVKTFFAVTTLGAVAVLIPPVLPSQALLGSFKKFETSIVIFGEEAEKTINEIKEFPKDITLISYTDLNANLKEKAPANKDVKTSDPAAILFTGGTTGTPKGAVLSHCALLRGSYNGCFAGGQIFFNNYMVLIPFFHVFGLVRNLLTSMNTGSNIYLVKENMRFFEEVKYAKPNIMVVVPSLANLIYSTVVQYGKEAVGGRLEWIIAGGAYVTPETIKNLRSVGIKCCPGYGLTESANLVAGSLFYNEKPDSVGVVYPEQEVKIVKGEIWIKGDNLFDGYYKDETETKFVMSKDGYMKTGDLGRFDKDGLLYIVGRSKNIIVLDNGENISPEALENALDNNPLVNSSLIYEDKNSQGRGIIATKIFPNYIALKKMGINNPNKAMQDVVDKVNADMPPYMKISKVIVLKEDFKRSGSLKIIRKANID